MGSGRKALKKLCEARGSLDVRTFVAALREAGCTVEQTGANEFKVKRAGYPTQIVALPHDGKDVKASYLAMVRNNLDVCEELGGTT